MKNILLLLAFFFICIQSAQSQNKLAQIPYDKGKSLFDDKKYSEAIPKFKLALKASKQYENAMYYLAESYFKTSQFDLAIEQFKNLETTNPGYWAWFYHEMGEVYSKLNDFDNAAIYYQKFLDNFEDAPKFKTFRHKAQYRLNYVTSRIALEKMTTNVKEPVQLPSHVNSTSGDYSPSSNPTGKIIYFTSTRKGGFSPDDASADSGDDDLYMIEKTSNGWTEPKLLPAPINSAKREGTSTFSADGQMMVYVICGRKDGIGSCDLLTSQLNGGLWTEPVNLGNVVNSPKWDSQPTISSDNNKIIFVSNRDGGYGWEDLWITEKNYLGEWGVPQNLGPMINTPFKENSPYLSPDGKTLYFASNGHAGYGEMDLFKSTNEGGKWSKPQNMGRPLNTEGDDVYFTLGGSGDVGYFSSNRHGGENNLYQVEIPEEMRPQPTVIVSGVVTNENTKEKLKAWILVEDLITGELIATNKSNSVTGKYLIVLPAGRNYSVSANSDGYFFYSQTFNLPDSSKYQEITKDIALKPIEKGAKIVLNNIFFSTGKASLRPESQLELEKAVDLMKINQSMVIEVGGHTDNVGNDDYNMKLSHNRAKSVREYLVKSGITAERIQAKGYGELNPIATNDTDKGRQANRRTEFIILEF